MITLFLLMPQAAPSGGGGLLGMLLPLLLIFIVFYFFIIRPQKKKEEERRKMIESVKKGDRIITIGGIHGKVVRVADTTVLVQVDDNTKIRFEKTAIASVQSKKSQEEKDTAATTS